MRRGDFDQAMGETEPGTCSARTTPKHRNFMLLVATLHQNFCLTRLSLKGLPILGSQFPNTHRCRSETTTKGFSKSIPGFGRGFSTVRLSIVSKTAPFLRFHEALTRFCSRFFSPRIAATLAYFTMLPRSQSFSAISPGGPVDSSSEFDELNAHFEQQRAVHEQALRNEKEQEVAAIRRNARINSALRPVEHPVQFRLSTKPNPAEKLFLRGPSRLPPSDHKLEAAMVPGTRFDLASHIPFHKPIAEVIKGSPAFPGANNDSSLPPRVQAMMMSLGIDSLPSTVPPLTVGGGRKTARSSIGSGISTSSATKTLTTAATTRQSSPVTIGGGAGGGEISRPPSPYRTPQASPQQTGAVTFEFVLPPSMTGLAGNASSPATSPTKMMTGGTSGSSRRNSPTKALAGATTTSTSSAKPSPPSSTHSSRRASPVREILDRAEMEERKRFWVYLTTTLGRKDMTAEEAEILFGALTKEERLSLPYLPAAMPAMSPAEAAKATAAAAASDARKHKASAASLSKRPASANAAMGPSPSTGTLTSIKVLDVRSDDRFAKAHDWLSTKFPGASGPGPGASTSLNRTAIGLQSVRQTLHQSPTLAATARSSAFVDAVGSGGGGRSPSPRGSPRASRSPSPSGAGTPGGTGSPTPAHHPRPWRRGQAYESLPHRQLFSYHAYQGGNTVGLGKIRASPGEFSPGGQR
jgi:hypothetical protein